MLMIELDTEAKAAEESLFADANLSIVDVGRIAIKPAYGYPKQGMLNRVHTIREAVEKMNKNAQTND